MELRADEEGRIWIDLVVSLRTGSYPMSIDVGKFLEECFVRALRRVDRVE